MDWPPSTPAGQIMPDTGTVPFPSPGAHGEADGPYFSTWPTIHRYPSPPNQLETSTTIPPGVPFEDPFWDEPSPPTPSTIICNKPQSGEHLCDPSWFDETFCDGDMANQGKNSHYCNEDDSDEENASGGNDDSDKENQWEQNPQWWDNINNYHGPTTTLREHLNSDAVVVSLKTAADYRAYAQRRGLVFRGGAPSSTNKRRRSHGGDQDEDVEEETQPSPPKKTATEASLEQGGVHASMPAPVFQRPAHLTSLWAFEAYHHEHGCDSSPEHYHHTQAQNHQYSPGSPRQPQSRRYNYFPPPPQDSSYLQYTESPQQPQDSPYPQYQYHESNQHSRDHGPQHGDGLCHVGSLNLDSARGHGVSNGPWIDAESDSPVDPWRPVVTMSDYEL